MFPALKSVHRSVRQRRFTPEADFPEMGFPNYSMNLQILCYWEWRVTLRATTLTSLTVNMV
jgi:hypothetical protein